MTSKLYDVDMAKERLTVYLDAEVARVMRVTAARRGLKDSEVVEGALREKLLLTTLDRIAETATLDWEDALELAVREQHASRKERTKAS